MRDVIVTGGRTFKDATFLGMVLHSLLPIGVLAHGAAPGADTLAARWAKREGVCAIAYPPDWSRGRPAGPIRNRVMLLAHPHALVVAFPGGEGTADCVRQARKFGMRVFEIAP